MRFEIEHTTRFTYSRPVFIEAMTLRLRPRTDVSQRVDAFSMHIAPAPAGQNDLVDAEGNLVTAIWFAELTDVLEVATTCVVHTLRDNPFDFVVPDTRVLRLPPRYGGDEPSALARFRSPSGASDVHALASAVSEASDGDAGRFAFELAAVIRSRVSHVVREHGDPMPPEQTLRSGQGSCRDLTVLYIDACRCAGLAARFVSGYEEGDETEDSRELHAWAEVYLPSAGWRAYDPTHGLAVADRHVALAAGPTPRSAAPTAGTFRGSEVKSHLQAVISISTSPDGGMRQSQSLG